jgi:hypothetical protein
MQSIESLESRLAAINIDNLSGEAAIEAKKQRRRIRERLAERRLEDAESWTKRDWLDVVEGMFDELGRIVDKLVFGKKQ